MKFEQGILHMFINSDVVCMECREKMKLAGITFSLDELRCESLYVYEGVVKDMLLQYKELMDEALYTVFLYPFMSYIRKKYRGYTLVIAPSSENAIKRRGFSHVEKMFSVLGMPMVYPFMKDDVEQKHRSIKQRHLVKKDLRIVDRLPDTPLLLVDDICTTGSTLSAMYEQIKNHKYPIRALVCSCHAKYVEIRRWKLFENCIWWIYTQIV